MTRSLGTRSRLSMPRPMSSSRDRTADGSVMKWRIVATPATAVKYCAATISSRRCGTPGSVGVRWWATPAGSASALWPPRRRGSASERRWTAPGVHGHHVDVGTGRAAFDAAATALRTWVPHRGIGADVLPPGQLVELGATVLVILRWGPVLVVAPDRIVAVGDEPRRVALAYRTPPRPPGRGGGRHTPRRV